MRRSPSSESSGQLRRSRGYSSHQAACLALGLMLFPLAVSGQPALPAAAQAVDIEEHLGQPVPGGLRFTDQDGHPVQLGDFLGGGRPLLLVLTYNRCPSLCSLVLRSTAAAMKGVSTVPGRDYRVLTVSIDPAEHPHDAARQRDTALGLIGRPGDKAAWSFLVGEAAQIRALADALGFRYAYDPLSKQYAHAAVVFVLTPEGMISRYLYGVSFAPRDLELALSEASRGRAGSLFTRVLLTCYRWDPASRRYGPAIQAFLRFGALLIFGVVATFMAIQWRKERRRG